MNTKFFAPVILLLLLGGTVFAQTPPPRSNASASTTAAAPAAVPMAKIGMLELAKLRDGVDDLKQQYEKLSAEFAPRATELQNLQASLEAKEKLDTSKYTQPQLAKLKEDYDQLKKEFDRKQEDYQALARKREEAETQPIYEKVTKFLERYATEHGLTMVFEAGAARETQTIIFRALAVDITEDFIKEYNKANPVAPMPKK